MKKMLLIRPPEKYLPHRLRPMAYLPIGLLQIAAVLKENNYEVALVDGIMPHGKPKEGGDNFFGITFEDIKQQIQQVDFDIVGISAQFTFQWENALKTAQVCKAVNPGCTVIMGGAHASVAFENILKECNYIDVVVRGEGEYVTLELVKAIRSHLSLENIKGIAFRENNCIKFCENKFIENLDALPFPAYYLVDMEKYFSLVKDYFTRTSYTFCGWHRGVTLITSRGCPFSCVFCSIHLHMGRAWRAHSAEYVLRHIEHLVNAYKVRYIHFEDDNFTLLPRRCEEILTAMANSTWGLRWDTPNGVRADTIDEGLLRACKASGSTHLIFGIESGCQRVLDEVIGKNLKLSKAEEAMRLAKKIGVDIKAFYMVGFPGESKGDIKKTAKQIIKYIWKYDCFGGIGMAVPLFGTRMYSICKEKNYFYNEPTIDNLTLGFVIEGIIKTPEFNPDFLKKTILSCSRKARLLKLAVFIKKIMRTPRLTIYFLKNIMTTPPSQWTIYYNKIVHFHHALMYDLQTNRRGKLN